MTTTQAVGPTRRIGVLVVHGIGEQRRGTTLRQLGDPLIVHLESVTSARGATLEIEAYPLSTHDGPDRVELEIGSDGRTARVIIAESRWAEAFQGASFSAMTAWTMKTGRRSIRVMAWNAARGLDNSTPPSKVSGVARVLTMCVRGILKLVAGAVVFLAFVLSGILPVLIVLLLLARLWKQTRGLADAVTGSLAASLGDAYTFVSKPIDEAAMVAQVRNDLAWLRTQNIESISIIAHSLGAAVVLKALQDEEDREGVVRVTLLGNALAVVGSAKRRRARNTARLDAGLLHGINYVNLATAQDPVSMGRVDLDPPSDTLFDSPRVDNQHSLLRDHTSYFSNVEQVIARIACSIFDHAQLPSLGESMHVRQEWAQELRTDRKNCESASTAVAILAILSLLGAVTPSGLRRIGGWLHSILSGPLKSLPDGIERWTRQQLGTNTGNLVLALVFLAAGGLVANAVVLYIGQNFDDRRAARAFESTEPRLYRWPGTLAAFWATILAGVAIIAHQFRRSMALPSSTVTNLACWTSLGALAFGLYVVGSNFLTMSAGDLEPRGLLAGRERLRRLRLNSVNQPRPGGDGDASRVEPE